MPSVLEFPEFENRIKKLAFGADPSTRLPAQFDPVKFEEWLNFLRELEAFRNWAFSLPDAPPSRALTLLSATTHQLIAGGEYLLGSPLSAGERQIVGSNVQFLKDSLVLDFSEVTVEQSERELANIFGIAA